MFIVQLFGTVQFPHKNDCILKMGLGSTWNVVSLGSRCVNVKHVS